MTLRFRTTVVASVLLIAGAGLTAAQPAPEPAKLPVPVEKPEPEAKKEKDRGNDAPPVDPKDPTSPSPKLKELLQPDKTGKLVPAAGTAPRMPMVSLRGRVVSRSHPAVALLEVDGKFFSITKGSSLPGGNNTMLRILDITSGEVRIEVLPLKEIYHSSIGLRQ